MNAVRFEFLLGFSLSVPNGQGGALLLHARKSRKFITVLQYQRLDIVAGMRRLRNVRRVAHWIRGAVAQLSNGTDYSAWPTTEAEVYLNNSRSASAFNYPAAEIWYTYRAIDQRRSGLCRVHFRDRATAGFYAGLHSPGSKVTVRYNPAVPNDSVMLEKDQPNPHPVAVAMQEHPFN